MGVNLTSGSQSRVLDEGEGVCGQDHHRELAEEYHKHGHCQALWLCLIQEVYWAEGQIKVCRLCILARYTALYPYK